MGKANRSRVRAFEEAERAAGKRFLSNAEIHRIERETGRQVILDVGGSASSDERETPDLSQLEPFLETPEQPPARLDTPFPAKTALIAPEELPRRTRATLALATAAMLKASGHPAFDPTTPRKIPKPDLDLPP
jgi:hypothetical protein